MNARFDILAAITSAALLILATPAAAAPQKIEVERAPLRRGSAIAPLPKEKATRTHPPYASGKCQLCHKREGPQPGPIKFANVNDVCFQCHEDVKLVMARKYKHKPSVENCTDCHNSHNANIPGNLYTDMVTMCTKCHVGIKKQLANGKVQHDAVTKDKKCSNCHNPHAANVQALLIRLPFDLCVNCHSKDGMVSDDGKQMTNYKKWLGENNVWHVPVKSKDCSACHRTHAGDHFRLLKAAYPAEFYAPYEKKNYALCYGCHNEKVVSAEETTTLTGFRDGSKNLHFVHVNRERGRTCRACHEVHAAKQEYRIREGVPYGPSGWILKTGFTKLPTGGQCEKTCHDTKVYNNKILTSSAPSNP
jgi:predicted CXXCH cytochrome family protein